MQVISLTIKQRQGVTVNQVQLVDVDNIGTPILEANAGADASFFLREAKRGPYPGEPSNHALTSFVVDQTIANIVAASFSIFSAHILTMKGRPKVALMGFNVGFVAGNILPYNGGSKFFYQEDADPDLVEYTCTETPAQILAQITPTPSVSAINVGQTVFVDANTGDDGTGLRERFDFMFATLEAAQAAALSGDTIVVYPGNYAPNSDLGVNGVNWYFYPQAVIFSATQFNDAGTLMGFNVLGNGTFTGDGSTVLTLTNVHSKVFFECESASILGPSDTSNVFRAEAGATINILHHNDITAKAGSAISVGGSAGKGGKIYVSGEGKITSRGITLIIEDASHDGIIDINSKKGVELTDQATSDMLLQQTTGTINLNCDINVSAPSSASSVFNFPGGAFVLNIKGNQNIDTPNHCTENAGGSVIFEGIINTNGIISVDNASSVFVIKNSELIANPAAAQEAISIILGKLRITNTRIVNLLNDAAAYGIVKAGGTLILDDATIVCAGATESIHAAAAQDVKIYSAVANVDVTPANITNLISGTVLYVDADVE